VTMYWVYSYLGAIRLTIRSSFLVLNLILLIGLLFPGVSVGIYVCTLMPVAVLIKKDNALLRSNIVLIFIVIFLMNIFAQTLLGFPPNFKLALNFLGNLVMVYCIISLLRSNDDLTSYLEGLVKLHVAVAVIFMSVALFSQGSDMFSLNQNYIYTRLNSALPFVLIEKQVMAPFLAFSGILAFSLIKPKSFWRNLFIFTFSALVLYVSFASRSVLVALTLTCFIFVFRRFFGYKLLASASVISVLLLIGVASIFFESYLDIIRLIDIRGVVFLEIIDEIKMNPFGVGYGNTVPYVIANNDALLLDSAYYFENLKDSSEEFGRMDIKNFPINIESSFFIVALEQGLIILVLLYTFFITKIARLLDGSNKLVRLYVIGSSMIFFSGLTEDNFLLIPFLFYISLFLRLVYFRGLREPAIS